MLLFSILFKTFFFELVIKQYRFGWEKKLCIVFQEMDNKVLYR